MREELYTEAMNGATAISMDLVNSISFSLIAQIDDEEELNEVTELNSQVQQLRTQAFKMAYKDYPIPPASVPLEKRREIQNLRNEMAEIYYAELLKELK